MRKNMAAARAALAVCASSRPRASVRCAAAAAALLLCLCVAVLAPAFSRQAQAASGSSLYSDVAADAWYVQPYDYIGYVSGRGIMTGLSGSSLFAPEENITRAQLATVLYRMTHADASATLYVSAYAQASRFSDVPGGMYYTAAVEWCADAGIISGDTTGTGEAAGTFRPEDVVTRQECATMLWRYSGSPAAGTVLSLWPDGSSVATYAQSAVGWCTSVGILTGVVQPQGSFLMPEATATRAQVAKMITVLLNPQINWGTVYAPQITL